MFYKLVFFGWILAAVNPNVEGSAVVNSTDDAEREKQRGFVRRNLIPTRQYCGFQHKDDRFSTSNTTELDEFPWLVQILTPYPPTAFHGVRCHGVLINNRYVLTLRYCGIIGVKVRLGQHALDKDVMCNLEDPLYPECTEATILLEIDQNNTRYYDSSSFFYSFALLRLKEKIQYSVWRTLHIVKNIFLDYVRPICLPINDTNRAVDQESFILSGWGAAVNGTIIKKKLTYGIVSCDECFKLDKYSKRLAKDYMVCFEPHSGNTETACLGDRGAPLIYSMPRKQWFVYALIADAVLEPLDGLCPNSKPILAIGLIEKILDWILDVMEP